MTRQNVNAFLADLGREAGFDFPLHPHLLRHATGYKLANQRYGACGKVDLAPFKVG
jgi:site-specific recombinase XerD